MPVYAGLRPAIVSTRPSGVMRRTRCVVESVTYTTPRASTAMPDGKLKRAAVPTPSAKPVSPTAPASVATVPSRAIVRTVCVPRSSR